MKKVIFISSLVIISVYIITLFTPANHTYTKIDCLESGLCKEGLEINIDTEKIVITKENCIKNQGKWREDISVCFIN